MKVRYFAGAVFGLAALASAQTGKLASYSVRGEFENVVNKKALVGLLGLQPEHLAMLKKNLFVCYPSDDRQLYFVYGSNDYQGVPSIVTTDAALQLYHVFFDSTLRWVEENRLEPALSKMTAGLLKDAIAQHRAAKNKAVQEAALRNAAYFGVAARLLGLKAVLPPAAERMVKKEMELIGAHKGFEAGAVFPYMIDYSQFAVRGHYTKTPKLQRFFKAMMWYGLAPFALKYELKGKPVLYETAMLQALLAVDSLYRKNLERLWNTVYEPTALYVGAANNATPAEIRKLADKTYGKVACADSYGDATRLKAFIAGFQKLPLPKIRSKMRGERLPLPDHQFRFMGQRSIPDGYILQELAGDRRIPSGLDVMAVLGSRRASSILDANPALFGSGSPAYQQARRKLIEEFKALPPATWKSNLYYGWLYALKALLEPAPKGYPSFMLGDAWLDKNLNTALGSWAELRHDTILYGLQSLAEMGSDEEPAFVPQFVEPNVKFYDRLIQLTKSSRDGLVKRNLLSKDFRESFDRFLKLLGFLRGVSIKELKGQKLTKDEHLRIRRIEGELTDLTETTMRTANSFKSLSQDDLDMALVADVHTQGNRCLEVGVGRALYLVAIVPIEGKLYAARGSALSFYEFLQPISDRLTDEKWKKILDEGKAPEPPFWIRSFFTPVRPQELLE